MRSLLGFEVNAFLGSISYRISPHMSFSLHYCEQIWSVWYYEDVNRQITILLLIKVFNVSSSGAIQFVLFTFLFCSSYESVNKEGLTLGVNRWMWCLYWFKEFVVKSSKSPLCFLQIAVKWKFTRYITLMSP